MCVLLLLAAQPLQVEWRSLWDADALLSVLVNHKGPREATAGATTAACGKEQCRTKVSCCSVWAGLSLWLIELIVAGHQ